MKNTYECMLLLDNREVKRGWDPLKQEIARKLKKYGAEIVSSRRWDERRLAYQIAGQTRGTFLLVYYKSDPEANTGIKRELELSEPVLRHMITTCAEVPSQAFEPEAEFDPNAIPTEERPAPQAAPVEVDADAGGREAAPADDAADAEVGAAAGSAPDDAQDREEEQR